MSVAQLQAELSKLTWQEKLVRASYLMSQPDVATVEATLGADWNRPEEDAAWQHLQRTDDRRKPS